MVRAPERQEDQGCIGQGGIVPTRLKYYDGTQLVQRPFILRPHQHWFAQSGGQLLEEQQPGSDEAMLNDLSPLE